MQGAGGSRDERNVYSLTVPWYAPTLDDVRSVGSAPPLGLVETGRTWNELDAGGFQVDVSYEGIPDGEDTEQETIEFDSDFKEEPLPAHPAWATIKEKYRGSVDSTGAVKFDEFLEKAYKGALGGAQAGNKVKNPLFGSKSYLEFSAIFRRTRIVEQLPGDLLSSIGSIQNNLPGGLPTPEGRNWLVMPPKVSKRGNVWQIRDEWKLSPKGGWPPEVYNLIQF